MSLWSSYYHFLFYVQVFDHSIFCPKCNYSLTSSNFGNACYLTVIPTYLNCFLLPQTDKFDSLIHDIEHSHIIRRDLSNMQHISNLLFFLQWPQWLLFKRIPDFNSLITWWCSKYTILQMNHTINLIIMCIFNLIC